MGLDQNRTGARAGAAKAPEHWTPGVAAGDVASPSQESAPEDGADSRRVGWAVSGAAGGALRYGRGEAVRPDEPPDDV